MGRPRKHPLPTADELERREEIKRRHWKGLPTCKKCGQQHLNFVACDQVEVWNAQQEENRKRRYAQVQWKHDPGLTPVVDRLETLQRVGVNRFVRVPDQEE